MLLGTLGASLLVNILAGKGINRAGDGILRAGYGNKRGQKTRKKSRLWEQNGFLMLPHILTNFDKIYLLTYFNKYNSIVRMNPDIMVFTLEIIYKK